MGTDVLVVYKKNHEKIHDQSIQRVEMALSQCQEVNYTMRAREGVSRADFLGRDLVIVVGGDGTLTSICHNVDAETPVMGVNSHPRSGDPDGSLGFFMDSTIDSFEADLATAIDGEAITNTLPRLQATITSTSGNIIRTDPALNDLLVANTHQYAPSKYRLQRGDIDEKQHSSGLLFSTWHGRGAWLSHITDVSSFEAEDSAQRFFCLARELAHGVSDLTWSTDECIITSDMHRGYAVPDGWDEYHFNRGASIRVALDGPVLRLLTFRNSLS